MTAPLEARIARSLAREVHPAVRAMAQMLGTEANARAVLFYGSNLRTGSLDGVLDFYVLIDGAEEAGIWPRVGYREWTWNGTDLRAKIATMTMAKFARASSGALLDTTIWTRFCQPSALAWSRDAASAAPVTQALAAAARTAGRLAIAVGPAQGLEEQFWQSLFEATYRAEFRMETAGRARSIIELNCEHFAGLLPLALASGGIACQEDGRLLIPDLDRAERDRILAWWSKRRRLGKPINLVRLLRASATFDGAARYAAWKIERHTGVPVKLTPWRERHPVLAAPGVLFSLWRARRR